MWNRFILPKLGSQFNIKNNNIYPLLVTWVLVIFVPRWRHTPALTVIVPLILAFVYTLVVINSILIGRENGEALPDMTTFEGVVTLFQDPTGVFGGWIHYCVYDPLVGRWIALDSVQRGASTTFHILIMVPVLLLSMFLPPSGWLLYMIVVRPFLLLFSDTGNIKSAKQE